MVTPVKVSDDARLREMVERFRKGDTMEVIAGAYGLTRQRIQQLFASIGVSKKDGGARVQTRARRQARAAERRALWDRKRLAIFGCTHAQFVIANDGGETVTTPSHAYGYRQQRAHVMRQGIAWEISFPDWVEQFRSAGVLDRRGRGRGHFAMVRIDATAPFKVGNVRVAPFTDVCGKGSNG